MRMFNHVWRKYNTMVYIILGKGFEPMEAVAPCDILRRGGTVEEMKLADTDMVVLPGGLGGVQSILASETSMNFIRLAYEKNCYVAAICAAPTILARLHITDGRKATCYPGMEDQMGTAQMIPCGAVQDGSVITGRAAGSADEFGLACLRALKGEETARQVASGIVYRA